MTASAASAVTRYTPSRPCPICGGNDRLRRGRGMRCAGYLTGDQRVAFCSREEKAGSLQVAGDSNCFPHRLEGRCGCGTVHGDAPPPPLPRRAVRDTRVFRPVAHYDYHDRDGNVRFQVVRLEPDPPDGDKRFTQRRVDPAHPGRWIEGQGAMEGVQLLPYRLPDLLRDPKRLILIVEGEKAVNALRARGLPATTCPMGAGKWWDSGHDCPRTELTSWMLADVAGRGDNRLPVVIGDNDDAGRRGAEATCRALVATGLDPQLLELVGVPEHGGADDWIDQDPTRTARDLIAQLPAGQRWLDLHPSEAEGQEPEGGGNGNGNGNGNGHNGNGNGHEEGHALPEFSDTRNAERFAARHGKGARFDHTRGLWRLYTGSRWRLDATEQCMTLAKDVVAHLPEEVPEWCDDPKARYRLHREILACESTMRLRALLANAQSRLHSTHETWDPNPWLLNCENGTVDLHTGQLHPHKPDEMQSKLAPVDYVPGAECPRWDAFLGRIFEHDPELIAFVQRAIGLTLIGTVLEHVLFVCYGRGANGKGTFIRALSALLGDYARATNPHLLTETKVPQHLTAIAELQGIRMATTSEQEGGFSERLAKMLTGGDRRNANFMFHDHFTYMPADTFWLETNHKPLITGNSEGIWRRLRLIPFSVQIPDDEQVPRYEDVLLREEAPGILRWCIDGCLAYQRQGLGQSPAVERATRQYRTEMDSMAAFLDQETVQAEADSVSAAVLFHRYKEWCEGSGERPTSQRFLGLRLSERGLASFRSAHDGNRTHWRGLRLRMTGEQLALPPGEDSLLADCQAVCRALWAEGADARELCSLILQTHGWEREGQPSAWLQAQDRDVLEAILPDAQTSLAEVRQQRGR